MLVTAWSKLIAINDAVAAVQHAANKLFSSL